MADGNNRPDFAALLAPANEMRDKLVARRAELKAEIDSIDEDLREIDRVLKTAGLLERRPQQKSRPAGEVSPAARAKVLAYVNTQDEVTAKSVAAGTGLSSSYSSKVLEDLRSREQIRKLRVEPAHPSGKGRRPVYGPWAKP